MSEVVFLGYIWIVIFLLTRVVALALVWELYCQVLQEGAELLVRLQAYIPIGT